MNRFDGKVALITGASSGIGAATAIHFASLGCSVAINGRNVERLNKVCIKCQEVGLNPDRVKIVAGDVSFEKEAESIVDRTVKHFGRLDILINNAGIVPGVNAGSIESASTSSLDDIFRTNFRAAFHMMQLAIPHLKKTKGNIINVSSSASFLATHQVVTYGASKAALDHLTKSVARDLGSSGVRVNAVNPGFVETDIFKTLGLPEEEVKAMLDMAKDLHVLERIADPMEVAKPIAFLASDEASFITGVTLPIDGGFVLKGGCQ